MKRYEATQPLKRLEGQDLRGLAERDGVTVFKNNKKNKG
jgi:hypothetical protein